MRPLVVGFDLDMTLIDSRPGIHTTIRALVDETGYFIDPDVVVNRLGPPLEQELAEWLPADQVDPLSDRFRELYGELGIDGTLALPGASAALAAVRARDGRSLVVTAKYEPNAWRCLEHTQLVVDDVVGWRHGPQKGETLTERCAAIYVGDTPPDMDAARIAGAVGIGVPSGPFSADELRAAGADIVLGSLLEFPSWLATTFVAG
jgi:phosphoglycolate phosphatase-like HAD superfamily hydrolase